MALLRLGVVWALAPAAAAWRALALEGGGVRALGVDAGLCVGLAAKNVSCLEPFDMISSASGSSWFAGELLFSESFVHLMEGMAADLNTASAQFKAGWIQPLLTATGVDEKKFDGLQTVVRLLVQLLLGTGDEDTIFLAQFFLATGLTWDHFVDVLLDATSALPKEQLLGSKLATPSAAGKTWLVDHTLLLPSSSSPGSVAQGKLFLPRAHYDVQAEASMLPATFSVRLGAGVRSSAPAPYLARPQESSTLQFHYEADWFLGHGSATSPALVLDMANGSVLKNSGRLPIARTVAASSAVFGGAIVDGSAVAEVSSILDAEVGVWISSKEPDFFGEAQRLLKALRASVGAETLNAFGDAGVHALIDAGYTDGTGIAQAVAAGASEVVVVLNSYSINDPEYVAQLFPGSTTKLKPGVPKELFPVFASPNASQVAEAFGKFRTLHLAPGSQFIKVLAFGSFEAVTGENRFFGTLPGRRIQLHVVNVGSELSIGFFENWGHYGQLIQEIGLTLADPANHELVSGALLPALQGAKVAPPTVPKAKANTLVV